MEIIQWDKVDKTQMKLNDSMHLTGFFIAAANEE